MSTNTDRDRLVALADEWVKRIHGVSKEDSAANGVLLSCAAELRAALSTAPAEQAPSTPAPAVDVPAMPEPGVHVTLPSGDQKRYYSLDQMRARDAQWAARLAAAAPQSVGDWCVGEYVSSADPRKRVKLLSEGAAEIAKDRAHRDFIRWLYVAPNHAAPTEPSDAVRDVLAERRRQVEVEGWTPEHDDEHDKGDLAYAAASYAIESGHLADGMKWDVTRIPPFCWPWEKAVWKIAEPRRMLVKSAALIIAEIERLDRAARKGDTP